MTFPMDESINPNIIVRGFMGNVGKSGHGIHCLGVRVGKQDIIHWPFPRRANSIHGGALHKY
ncbi:BEM_collapsed_G0013320.mRNA.1.CDS.1 [Saccharomyces cerevisiae]|nr:BEM_collapsed_G0013320.mRNA.1.CDS.1 [Saccharomyces cerevisiae]